MAVTRKGWNRQLMLSLFKKEATYDAGVTMSNANACQMSDYEIDYDWNDVVTNDKDGIIGTEFGSYQEITEQGFTATYKESKCKPNTLAGLGMLALGAITSTQDEALASYRHKITPVAVNTALPSGQAELLDGGLQYAYKGVKVDTLKLSGKAGGYLELESNIIGSGTRATSATAFAAKISESWMKLSNCKVWFETGANISIDATLTQALENISSATPDTFHTRLESFEFTWNNNLKGQAQHGGGGVLQDLDYGRRNGELKFTLLFSDTTELDYYTSQAICAIEFDLKGAIIAAGSGTDFYYGAHLIIPKLYLKKAPLPKGGVGDILTADYECECMADATNAAVILEVYNAQAAYLAA